jgi:hypothetical protein
LLVYVGGVALEEWETGRVDSPVEMPQSPAFAPISVSKAEAPLHVKSTVDTTRNYLSLGIAVGLAAVAAGLFFALRSTSK